MNGSVSSSTELPTDDYELKTLNGDDAHIARGKSVEDLNSMFRKAEDADRTLFAEMRSNVLLASGEHYSKKNNRFWNRLRDSRLLNVNKKLRLTKNHLQRITKIYRNNLLKYAPGVKCTPQLDKEMQDVKDAEMHQAVWEHVKKQTNYKKNVASWAKSFIDIGECATKIFYDPNKGDLIGYEPLLDPFTGQPVMENQQMQEMFNPETGEVALMPIEGTGNPVPDQNKPVFSGQLVHERILPFNLLRDPDAKSMDDSAWLCVRKMTSYSVLKRELKEMGRYDDCDKLEKNRDETFLVFDGSNGKYEQSKNQVLLREFYFKPSKEYPNGYFYIATKSFIVHEGELPGGIFPIEWEGFDEIETTPRKRSIIKQLRPYQAEINRAASQAATQQITLGDDKLVVNSSAKIEHGSTLPGVRVIKTNTIGSNGGVSVIPGRAGDQFAAYILGQIDEMYKVANVDEDYAKKENGNMDVWATLFGSIRNKKEFSIYSDCFESFLVGVCKKSLELARYHYPDNEIIQMVGKKEQVNMEEFRRTGSLNYRIEIEPSTDDAESIMGRQMMINHALQYVGNQLEREDIGKMLKESPMGNFNSAFDDFTVDYENAKNDILQLERGQIPNLNKYENTQYKIRAIVHRMKQADFQYLDEGVQAVFDQYLQTCEQVEAQKAAEIQRAQAGFIPDSGGLITLNGVKDPEGNVLRVPYAALEWLVAKLAEQGMMQEQLQNQVQNDGAIADMSQMISNQGIIPSL